MGNGKAHKITLIFIVWLFSNIFLFFCRCRSLVALSLILALLLFKPAPLYILDEVDAALDLSHTQNIGQMLRTHFQKSQVTTPKTHSPYLNFICLFVCSLYIKSLSLYRIFQFIVVSLKDGMFNNANVLFRTKFVDGVSTVTRHVQPQQHRGTAVKTGNSSLSSAGGDARRAKKARLQSSEN